MSRIQQHPLECDPSRSPIPGSAVVSVPIRESTSSRRRKIKDKSYKLHDHTIKHIDSAFGVTHLEIPSKHRKLVKKKLPFSTGPE